MTSKMPKLPGVSAARVTSSELEWILLGTLRIPLLFSEGRQIIRMDHFDPMSERKYRMLWGAALAVAGRHDGTLPTGNVSNLLQMEIERRQLEDPLKLEDRDLDNLLDPDIGLIHWIWDYPTEQIFPEDIRAHRTDFVRERELDKFHAMVDLTARTGYDHNRRRELEDQWQRVTSVNATGSNKMLRPVMDESILDAPPDDSGKLWSTGLKFLDIWMNGGQKAGEVYTLMGPSGVGKTCMALEACIEAARTQRVIAESGKESEAGLACYFSFEMPFDELVGRQWSYAAMIHSDAFKDGIRGVRSKLSSRGKLKPYELAKYKAEIRDNGMDKVDGEVERLLKAMEELKPYLYLGDMAGLDPSNRLFGVNGIDDLVVALKAIREESGKPIAWVGIDYAGLVVNRYMNERNIAQDQKRHYLNSFVLDAIAKIAIPFKCPVWCLHQLNVEGNKRQPGQVIHHSQAAEATAFAHNASFAFQLGNKDKNELCSLFCTKTRRAKGNLDAPVLKIDGAFARMYDVSDDMIYDLRTHQYVPKDQAISYVGKDGIQVRPRQKESNSAENKPARGGLKKIRTLDQEGLE
jgi:replicative DNA helicase